VVKCGILATGNLLNLFAESFRILPVVDFSILQFGDIMEGCTLLFRLTCLAVFMLYVFVSCHVAFDNFHIIGADIMLIKTFAFVNV